MPRPPVSKPLDDHVARAVIAADLDLLRPFEGEAVPTVMLLTAKRRFLRHSRSVGAWRDFPEPAAEPGAALEALVGLARAFKERPVLYYADDSMLRLVHDHRARLEAHYRFSMPEPAVVAACLDKLPFRTLAQEAGLLIPKTAAGGEVESFDDVADFGLPLVIKPSSHVDWFRSEAVALAGGGARKVVVARDRAEFEALLAATRRFTDRFVVQEFIPGGEEQVYSYHAFAGRDFRPLAAFAGRKIRTNPAEGGESTYLTLVRDDAILRLGDEIVRQLSLCGPVKIDIKRDPGTARDYVLEINLRYNLWHQLGAACGVNLQLIAYRCLTGAPVGPRSLDYRTDIRWIDLYGDLRAFFGDYWPTGALTLADYMRSLRAPKVYHLFSWSDPAPLFLAGADLLAAKARRALFLARPLTGTDARKPR